MEPTRAEGDAPQGRRPAEQGKSHEQGGPAAERRGREDLCCVFCGPERACVFANRWRERDERGRLPVLEKRGTWRGPYGRGLYFDGENEIGQIIFAAERVSELNGSLPTLFDLRLFDKSSFCNGPWHKGYY